MNFRDHVLGTFMVRCKVKTPKGGIIETEIPMLSEGDGLEFMDALNKAMAAKPPRDKSLPRRARGRTTRVSLSGDAAGRFMDTLPDPATDPMLAGLGDCQSPPVRKIREEMRDYSPEIGATVQKAYPHPNSEICPGCNQPRGKCWCG